jgi:predicted deacylase
MLDRAALVVLPSVNVLAIHAGRRTFPELGDLNRFYPGEPPESISVFPMQRIAGAILNLFEQFEASMLLDLHES